MRITGSALAKTIGDGGLKPGESTALSTLLGNAAIEIANLEERIERLDASLANR